MTNEAFVNQTIQHLTQVAANAIASVTSEISELSKTNNSVAALNLTKINNTANKAITDISNAYTSGIGNIAGIIDAEVIKANEVKVLAEQQLNDKVASAIKEIDEILNSGRAILQKDVDAVVSESSGVIPEKGREQALRVTRAGNETEASIRRLLSLTAEAGKAASVGTLVESDIAIKRNYRIRPNITPTLCIKHPNIFDTVRGLSPQGTNITVKNGGYYSGDSKIASIKDGCMDISKLVYEDGGVMKYAKCAFATYFFNGTDLFKNGVKVSGEDIDWNNIVEYAKFAQASIDDKTCVDISLYGLDLTEYNGSTKIVPNTLIKTDSYGYIPNSIPSAIYKNGGKLSAQTAIVNRTIYIDKDNVPYIAKRDVANWANKDVADANFVKFDISSLFEALLTQ